MPQYEQHLLSLAKGIGQGRPGPETRLRQPLPELALPPKLWRQRVCLQLPRMDKLCRMPECLQQKVCLLQAPAVIATGPIVQDCELHGSNLLVAHALVAVSQPYAAL